MRELSLIYVVNLCWSDPSSVGGFVAHMLKRVIQLELKQLQRASLSLGLSLQVTVQSHHGFERTCHVPACVRTDPEKQKQQHAICSR